MYHEEVPLYNKRYNGIGCFHGLEDGICELDLLFQGHGNIQRLFNHNTLDLCACLIQLKQALKIEDNKCIKNNNKHKLLKYHFIFENL